MKNFFVRNLALIALLLATLVQLAASPLLAQQTPQAGVTIGQFVADFSLKEVGGKPWSLAADDEQQAIVVIFMGTECPLMQLYAPRLAEMANEFAAKGVAFVGINSNQQDGLAEISAFARTHKIGFPILKDPGNRVADQFGATRTPEVFLLDALRQVRYHGAIDDQYHYGIQRTKADHNWLRDALTSLVAGEAITIPQSEAVGCQIGRILTPRSNSTVTYSKQISRILQKRCLECHRSGEVAPFALTDYDEVVGWAGMIAEVVEQRRMPPWHADERFGHFANDARLTDLERQQIAAWVEAGAPEGDAADLPAPRKFVEGWRIGEPDQVIYMSDESFPVPAEGVVPYKHFVVDPGFTEDKWIQAAECRIGNRAVVHHIVVAAASRDRARSKNHSQLQSDWLAATAPGARPMVLPKGLAKRVPAGSKLVFQMHYTPNGTAQEDRSSIGLVFADPQTVRREVVTQKAANTNFHIPPGADNHEVKAIFPFKQDAILFALFPHMHLRGKAFRYTATYPNGETEVLLNVPRYDFNWQNGYEFAEAKQMPRGTVLECVAHFDNSASNPANPDPTKAVSWGDQTWDEMMIGYFDMALDEPRSEDKTSTVSRTQQFIQLVEAGKLNTDKLLESATVALQSQDSFKAWCVALQKSFPQVERVDWMSVGEGKLTVRRVAEAVASDGVRPGLSVPAAPMHLAQIASNQELVVIPDTSAIKTPDFRLMNRLFGSSLHVPVVRNEQDGVVSFWSGEKNAFPTPAIESLEPLVRALVDDASSPR